jgi:hypothetical protein
MTQGIHDMSTTKVLDIEKNDKENSHFSERIIRLSALASNRSCADDFNLTEAENKIQSGLKALSIKGGLQEMLAAQMLSLHQFQQMSLAMANEPAPENVKRYFTNTAIKLANIFVQQANLLNKLQGNGEQKIIVEHVEVHNGGQAVVGNIGGGP